MESATTNAELLRRKEVLDRLIAGQVTQDEFDAAKAFVASASSDAGENTKRLAHLITQLEISDLNAAKVKNPSAEYEFLVGRFYFYERRFIEAAHSLSLCLDKKPGWLRARNLLARCFYFVGNTDRAFAELQYVLTTHLKEPEEMLDALFLMGAIAVDSPRATQDQIEKGIGAWKMYLKLAPQSPFHQKIKDGLEAFEHKKKAPTGDTGDIKKDALLAIEGSDMLDAEHKIIAALKKMPRDDELKVALARVYVKTGRVKDALAEFAGVIKKNPTLVIAYHYQGMAFMMSSDPRSAIRSWERVIELDSAYADRFNLKGRIAIAQNLLKKEAS